MKKISALILFAFCIMLAGCVESNPQKEADGKGYISYDSYEADFPYVFDTYLMKNEEDRANVLGCNDYFKVKFDEASYGDGFFDNYGLILIFFKYSSSEQINTVSKVEKLNNEITVTFNVNSPSECDADLRYLFFTVKVDKALISDAKTAKIKINNNLLNNNSSYYYRG